MRLLCHLAIAFSIIFAPSFARATLYDRGGGLIYDSTLNITWLQDANYAKTSGYERPGDVFYFGEGRMNIGQAYDFANSVNYYDSVRGRYLSDWRLPHILPLNGAAYQLDFRYDGSSDVGYNITAVTSELAYMWYVNLGNLSNCSSQSADRCIAQANYSTYDSLNRGPFINLQYANYWSENFIPASSDALAFSVIDGQQFFQFSDEGPFNNFNSTYVWLVRDGDVSGSFSVPEPNGLALNGLLLVVLAVVRRSRRRPHPNKEIASPQLSNPIKG